jgi:nucleoid-associated protein YgaU
VKPAPAPSTPTPASGTIGPKRQVVNGTYSVQDGDNLWAIAQDLCSSGLKWPDLFSANRDKIENPRLIFPGQWFVISCVP